MKIISVFGTRPEAIKMAPLVTKLNSDDRFKSFVCVTGQHREMLDQVLDIFKITPDYDLKVMQSNQSLSQLTARILESTVTVLDKIKPNIVLVHGDTTSALAVSLAAYYKKIPIGHVEAGLRTGNLYSPWPEEANRKLIGALASLHFAPTENAKSNLLNEGVNKDQIFITGNTVIDALLMANIFLATNHNKRRNFEKKFHYLISTRDIILITCHRRENFGEGLKDICKAILQLSKLFPDKDFLYPVHLNPLIKVPVYKMLEGIKNIYLTAPLDYLDFVYLLNLSKLILTDSGGIQEEGPALKKPVLVMRNTTERPEGIKAGTAILVGTKTNDIVNSMRSILLDKVKYKTMCNADNPYGNGTASLKIIDCLLTTKF